MPFFRYHFYDGKAPVQIWAPTQQDAESVVRSRYGSNFTLASQGEDQMAGYTNIATGSQGGGGTPPVDDGGNVPPDVRADLDEALKMSAFSSGMRQRGFNTEGPLGGLLRSQAAPAYANFSLAKSFGGGGSNVPDENAFSAYTANTGPNAYSNALNLYRQASTSPYGAPSLSDALNRAGVGDTTEQKAFRGNFMDVARGAARARYSPAAAKFLPNEETLDRQFADQMYQDSLQGSNARGVSVLDFLKRQYGF